jgi:hypothetical protein
VAQPQVGPFSAIFVWNEVISVATATAVTITTLDAAARIPHRLDKIGVSRNFFSEYTGVPAAELSRCFTGKKRLENDLSKKLEDDLKELEWAADWFFPFQIPTQEAWRVRNFVRACLQMKEEARTRRALRELWNNAA